MGETSNQPVSTAEGYRLSTKRPNEVWRVGYAPKPWDWTPWEHSPFTGRWDDPDGRYRTLYAGTDLLGCLLEVLADFRPDPGLDADLAEIDDDPEHPTAPPGELPTSWLIPRRAARANLHGTYIAVTSAQTITTLRATLGHRVGAFGVDEIDAATLRLPNRDLTRAVSAWLYAQTTRGGHWLTDGIAFESRHGDDHELWAVFERDTDPQRSQRIAPVDEARLDPDHPDVRAAMDMLDLQWAAD